MVQKKISEAHVDLLGGVWSLQDLDAEERRLVADFRKRASSQDDWNAFDTYWMQAVAAFYDARGLSRKESRDKAVYRIAQDLSNRLAIATGQARSPDYRDELEEIIRARFPTRRAFCEATGLSEDMLSHVLAHRKHLAMDTLAQALGRIGFAVRLLPSGGVHSTVGQS